MKHLLLESVHEEAGAQFMEFAGWRMPIQYSSIAEEHMAVRNRAGLFDVSHMGEFLISGQDALKFIQRVTSNDVLSLEEEGVQYSTVLNERGGVKDDVMVYRMAKARFLLVCNASNVEKLENWFAQHKLPGVDIVNISDTTVLLALQGPAAQEVLQPFSSVDLRTVEHFNGTWAEIADTRAWISRTGYTGEDGFEIFLFDVENPEVARKVWDVLIEAGKQAGLKPCGLGARDTLRLEAGLCLYGNELEEDITPLEARISFVVKFEKEGGFIGREALLKLKEQGLHRIRVGFRMLESGVPRKGMRILVAGEEAGVVTSGTFSPLLKQGIGMGYLPPRFEFGQPVEIEIRGKKRKAEIVKWPFYDERRYGRMRENHELRAT